MNNLIVIPCNLDDDYWPQNVYQFINKNKKVLDAFVYYRPQLGKSGVAANLGEDIQRFPTTIIIDRDGKLASKWSGYGDGLIVYELNQLLKDQH